MNANRLLGLRYIDDDFYYRLLHHRSIPQYKHDPFIRPYGKETYLGILVSRLLIEDLAPNFLPEIKMEPISSRMTKKLKSVSVNEIFYEIMNELYSHTDIYLSTASMRSNYNYELRPEEIKFFYAQNSLLTTKYTDLYLQTKNIRYLYNSIRQFLGEDPNKLAYFLDMFETKKTDQ